MLLSMAERRLGVAERLARCFPDRRDPARITHTFAAMMRAGIFAVSCAYEDADDQDFLRADPAFRLASGRLPDAGHDLCSQRTLSRLENDTHRPRQNISRQYINSRSFRHKGLRRLFEEDDPRGVNAEHVRKLKQILALLDAAETIEALDYATFRLHPLKGDLKGWWSLTLRANWRVIFRFADGNVLDVDLVDYH